MSSPEKCRLCRLDQTGDAAKNCDNHLCPSKVVVKELTQAEFEASGFLALFLLDKPQDQSKSPPETKTVVDHWGDPTNFSVL